MGVVQEIASAAAAAAVGALQAPATSSSAAKGIAAIIPAAHHCSITLNCSPASSTRLCSGNLLGAGNSGQASLVTGVSLSAACIKERKAKMLQNVGAHSQHYMDDVTAIVADCGCSAIVCLPLLATDSQSGSCSADGAPCLGALTVAFPSASDITSSSLKGALLLAHALAKEQQEALQNLATLVSTMLLAPPSPPDAAGSGGYDSDGWSSDVDAGVGWDQSGSEGEAAGGWQRGGSSESGALLPGSSARGGGTPDAAGTGAGAADTTRLFSRSLLVFRSRQQEQQFAAYHAKHMQRVDICAYLIALVFFLLETFVPGTPFFLAKRIGWRCLFGFGSMFPGLLLLTKRTSGWFAARRDLLLAYTWTYTTLWMTSVSNYMHILDRGTFRNPLYLQSFGWLTVVGLAFQMRFRFQVLAAPLAYAVNTQLLPAICDAFFEEQAPRRCVLLGLMRVYLHGVALPLACCYVFETHARRLFSRPEAPPPRRGGGWAAQRGRRAARASG